MKLEHWWRRSSLASAVKITGIRSLFLNNLLRGMAGSMVGIFFPAYLYLWGASRGGFVMGIKMLVLSLVIERLGVMLLSLPIGVLVNRIGFKLSILVASVLLSLWFILAAVFPPSLTLIVVLALISAVEIPIYWLARLSIMSIDGDKKAYGEEVSFLALIDQATAILGPFVGGILVAVSGFGLLFSVTTFFCILSAVPIFFVGDYRIKDGISLSGFLAWLGDKKERHLHLAFSGQGLANFVDSYFWPLFIFLSVGSFTILGTIVSITFGLSSVAIFLAGKIFDRKRALGGREDENEYGLATVFLSLVTLIRPVFTSVIGLFSLDAVFRMSLPFWGVDYDAYLFTAGKRVRSPLEFYTYREVVYSLARVIGPITLLLFLATPYFWWIVFGLGSVGTLMTLGMRKES